MKGTVLQGDAIEQMANIAPGSINMCITSPPYFRMRDYGVDGQIGMEIPNGKRRKTSRRPVKLFLLDG